MRAGTWALVWVIASISQVSLVGSVRQSLADGGRNKPIGPAEVPARLRREPRWVTGPRCGPNSLYVLLRLHGIEADIEEVTQRCHVDPKNGCSIGDLERVAREMGLAAEVRYVGPSDLTKLTRPFIANLRAGDEQPSSAHFLVIFDYREVSKDFGVIDGTAGTHAYRDAGLLMRSYSGYVLIPRRSSFLLSALRGSFLVEISAVACALALKFRARGTLTRTRATAGATSQ